MKDIIFISEIQDPETSGGSTQIMTKNIIKGLYENNKNLIFIAIIDENENESNINKNYFAITNKIIFVKSKLKSKKSKNKYQLLLSLLKMAFFKTNYDKEISELKNKIGEKTLIITHSPTIESIVIANELRKNKKNKMHQYWSDPIAITGIYPEELNIKRKLHYWIEKKMLGYADKIIYGTEILYKYQSEIYKRYSKKMEYVDVSYIDELIEKKNSGNKKLIYGYTGNYYKNIRNIKPLYESFIKNNKKLIICGNGDQVLQSTSNIEIVEGRYSQNDIKKIEEEIDVMIVILNNSCIQIPGKVFYHVNTDKEILVIIDGRYGEEIKEYLEKFKRYIFCENNKESIEKAIEGISKKQNYDMENLSPKKVYNGLL